MHYLKGGDVKIHISLLSCNKKLGGTVIARQQICMQSPSAQDAKFQALRAHEPSNDGLKGLGLRAQFVDFPQVTGS